MANLHLATLKTHANVTPGVTFVRFSAAASYFEVCCGVCLLTRLQSKLCHPLIDKNAT